MLVLFLRSAQRGTEQQMANPGLDEGEGGAMRVSCCQHHLCRVEENNRIFILLFILEPDTYLENIIFIK